VDRVVYDTDLRAEEGVLSLYRAGVPQRQIVRLLSVGLLGTKRGRRLVPTEWSITAVDDIIGNHLRRAILDNPPINEYRVFGFKALGNNVQYLLLPSAWMYEALEGWLTTPRPTVLEDYELSWGRKTYPENVVGAYHAARLPALEYLHQIGRQAGVIAFLEVSKEWVPLGVWRFREIGREAFKQRPFRTGDMREALEELGRRLTLPLKEWLRPCKLVKFHQEQRRLEEF
jgi:hypothetical protein